MKLVLHNYWRSSASHRVRIGLGLKELAYDYVHVGLGGDQHADAYGAMNPMHQVPTLEVVEDDGTRRVLVQSLPILEYLDERWPARPILPRDPYLRARARALAEIVNSGIQPLQNLATQNRVKEMGGDPDVWTKQFIEKGLAGYAALVATSGSGAGKFSVGDAPSIADCCLVPQLASARRFGADVAKHTVLFEIEERCLALPAFAAAAPDKQPDAPRS
jgi:maleylpyruvate isomerase